MVFDCRLASHDSLQPWCGLGLTLDPPLLLKPKIIGLAPRRLSLQVVRMIGSDLPGDKARHRRNVSCERDNEDRLRIPRCRGACTSAFADE